MAQTAAKSASRLCIFCRCLEPASQTCPRLLSCQLKETSTRPWDSVTDFSAADAALLERLQGQPSSLCQRCSDYGIINAISTAEPLIENPFGEPLIDNPFGEKQRMAERWEYHEYMKQFKMPLGLLSSLHLTPSCQFCRLIYRIMPRAPIDPGETGIHVTPFRSFFRQHGWDLFSPDLKRQSSIMLKLEDVFLETRMVIDTKVPFLRGADVPASSRQFVGESIALNPRQAKENRTWQSARCLQGLVDPSYLSFIRRALTHCETHHQVCRRGEWPTKLSVIRVIDVIDRRVVPCPEDCDYLALSYVWGGVVPEAGALESGSLPRTIEDAMTLTKALGRRFLWVDALCIDQSPCLTAEQAAAKQEQLGMMHLIYQYATLTIVAVSGKNSNHGLPGVSSNRARCGQLRESIEGHDLFTVPPVMSSELSHSEWQTRAWTLQESYSSRRLLEVSANQCEYGCKMRICSESEDDREGYFEPQYCDRVLQIPGSVSPVTLDYYQTSDIFHRDGQTLNPQFTCLVYASLMETYTEKHMSRDDDSLNAFLGILGLMQQRQFPMGFIWGLPLRSHPQFLGWRHSSDTSPRRRHDFPSWSWAGWQGPTSMPESCMENIIWDAATSSYRANPQIDLTVQLMKVRNDAIAVQGWVVNLEVRTEPLSEAFKPGSDESLGCVRERDFLHNNTLPSGSYSCFTIQRYTESVGLRERQSVDLLLLNWRDKMATRQTSLTLRLWMGKDFMSLKPKVETIWLH
ncbi:hypothetical protein XA68_14195 [Ophiocordyceps unilateralis]|uniref:Heterokaryon incompatibility domain-containing protein n=1 Tax=Ophiocordyceps unilateralis TaxID=268505 RepID=A0A2A9PB84_OPHUN|nr:hypothetical protein XA68_14195 [Ophiocordyceps unilateralis]